MATDFRFNGQQSYSPLLSALAEAPMNKAKLQIAQEQNQRQRLSDLLTNISSAAGLARTFQTMGAIKRQSDLAGGPNTVGGNAALISPEGFSGVAGQLPATMTGLNAAFPSVQPQTAQGASQPDTTQSQTPGSVPISNDAGVLNPDAIKNKFVMKTLFGEPKQQTDTNTQLNTEYYPGTGIPPKITNPPPEGELPPVQKAGLMDQVGKFRSDPDYKDYVNEIQAARNLKVAINSKNPIAQLNVLGGQIKDAGISRVNPTTLALAGHDPSIWESLKQKYETAQSGKFTKVNTDELNSLADMMMSSAQAGLKNLGSSYSGDYKSLNPKSVDPKIVDSMFNQAMAPHMKGPISVKPFSKTAPSGPKVGEVDSGYRFKGGDPADPKSWIKKK